MATELATAYISLVPSLKGAKRSIERDLGGAGENAARSTERSFKSSAGRVGSSFKSAFKGLAIGLGAGLAGAAVGIKSVVDAASDLEESKSKINAVFGPEVQADIEAWAKGAATALGQSEQQALAAAGGFGNLLTSFGLAPKLATDMSKSFTELASDLASFNNTSVDEALQALTSGLSGETEPLKKYGVALDDASLKAKALEMGLVKSTVDRGKLAVATTTVEKAELKAAEARKEFGASSLEARDATAKLEAAQEKLGELMQGKVPATLDPAQKAQAAYALVMERTKTAQGDFARTSDGLANKQKILGAKFANLKTSIGAAFLPIILRLTTVFETRLMPIITQVGGGIRAFVMAFQNAGDGVTSSGFAGKMESAAITVRRAFDSVSQWWKTNGPQIRETAAAVFQAVGQAIADVVAVVMKYWPQIQKTITEVITTVVGLVRERWPQIQKIISQVVETVQVVVAGVVDFVTTLWRNFGDNILGFVKRAWGPIQLVIKGALDVIQGLIKTVTSLIKGDWANVWEGIKQVFRGVWDVIQGIVRQGLNLIVSAFGIAWEVISAAVGAAWEGIANWISDGIDALVEFVVGIPGRIASAASTMWDGIKTAWTAAKQWVADGLVSLVGWFAGIPESITNAISGLVDAITAPFETAFDWVLEKVDAAVGLLNDTLDKIKGAATLDSNSLIAEGLGSLKPKDTRPRHHSGGVIAGPRGHEMPIVGLAGERVLSLAETAQYDRGPAASGGIAQGATFVGANAQEILRALDLYMRREARNGAVL